MKEKRKNRPQTLLEVLRAIPDPRGRRGRRYPLATLLGLLLLAALAGQTSLKGMVEWIQLRLPAWMARYIEELDLWDIPSYGAFYHLLRKLDPDELAQRFQAWLQGMAVPAGEAVEVWAADGKTLRGSRRRDGRRAWRVLHVLEQTAGILKALGWVQEEQGEETRLVELLWTLPDLEDTLLTLDAGNMDRTVATVVVAKKGGM